MGSLVIPNVSLWLDIDNGGGSAHVRVGVIWEIFVPSTQFYCESENTLNFKILKSTVF